LKETINKLQDDTEKLVSELSVQGDLIKTKDERITKSTEAAGPEQWICLEEYQETLAGPPVRIYNKRRRVINVMVIPTCG
jgi:hypothetical protein